MPHYLITHSTTYQYSQSVQVSPHIVRLQPRSDVAQSLLDCRIEIEPTPRQQTAAIDLDGNASLRLVFGDQQLDHLHIQITSTVETHRTNPFDFLLEPWAAQLPIDYPAYLQAQLYSYFHNPGQPGLDPVALELAQEIALAVEGNVVSFLWELTQRIHKQCQYWVREMGAPWPAGVTWRKRSGTCRDFSVLFMEVCRSVGLAARFVSGYHEGDEGGGDRHLHAWVEVYLPGAGWRGYDPTYGLAAGDQHVALVGSAYPLYAAPVTGTFRGTGVRSEMGYSLTIVRQG